MKTCEGLEIKLCIFSSTQDECDYPAYALPLENEKVGNHRRGGSMCSGGNLDADAAGKPVATVANPDPEDRSSGRVHDAFQIPFRCT